MPAGAFYAFPNVSGTGMTGAELADKLLYEAGVCVLCGTAFGKVCPDHIRISYANSQPNLRRALERFEELVSEPRPARPPDTRRARLAHSQVPLTALVIALGAAVVHAFWNLVVARSTDNQATTAVAIAVGVVVPRRSRCCAGRSSRRRGRSSRLSSVLELVYFCLLTTAYRRAEMSLVYPIARGIGAGDRARSCRSHCWAWRRPSPQAAGVGARRRRRDARARPARRGAKWSDVAMALAVATSIAGYTLVDKEGVRYADPVTYVTLILVVPAIASRAVRRVARRLAHASERALKRDAVAHGIGTVDRVHAGAGGADHGARRERGRSARGERRDRGCAWARSFLKERVGPTRVAGAVVVALGVALIVLG